VYQFEFNSYILYFMYKHSLVIPCFNESLSLQELVQRLVELVEEYNIQFILVNNGSTDKTNEILSLIVSDHIKVVTLHENQGYGGGIKAGLKQTSGEYIGWIHADLQYSIGDVTKKLQLIEGNFDYIKGHRKNRNFLENIISLLMSCFESMLFTTRLFDINAQPTIFKKSFHNQILNGPDDFTLDLYSYVLAKKNKLLIKRFDVNFLKRTHGKSHWNHGIISILRMIFKNIIYSFKLRFSV
jgi:glycosyltransferase involved in cell wall biosynthesis